MTNVVFYSMELKFILCKNLVLAVGEIGPVEVELILSLLYFFVGGFGHSDFLQQDMGQIFGITNETFAGI